MSAESSPRTPHALLSCVITLINAAVMIGAYSCSDANRAAFMIFLLLASLFCFIEAMLVAPSVILSREDDEGPRATWTGLAILATFLIAITTAHAASMTALITGAVLMAIGILLRAVAIHTLGPRFMTEFRADAPLIRHGIYRWLDHPSEAGLLCVTAGAGLLFRSAAALVLWLGLVLPLTTLRIRAENSFLRKRGVR